MEGLKTIVKSFENWALKIIEYEIHMFDVCMRHIHSYVLNWEFGIFCLHTFPKQEETTKKFKMKRVSKPITIP